MAAVGTRAVLLRAHDYGDTSRILRFYTSDFGLLSVVGKGVRGKSGRGAATFATFASGELTAYVRRGRDLHTMKEFGKVHLRQPLSDDVLRFAGASAVGELVLAHAEQGEEGAVFAALEAALDTIAAADASEIAGTVIAALWAMTGAFGFSPHLDPCARCSEPLGEEEVGRFDLAAGGVRCEGCAEGSAGPRVGPGARRQLLALLDGRVPVDFSHPKQHFALLADFVAYHLASRPLKSFHFLGRMMPETGAA